MSKNQDCTKSPTEYLKESLSLPKADLDNITVLSQNLPNTPILPWNRFGSPWRNKGANTSEQSNNKHYPSIFELFKRIFPIPI